MMRWRWLGVVLLGTTLAAACGSETTSEFIAQPRPDGGATTPPGSIIGDPGRDGGTPPPATTAECVRTCSALGVACGPSGDGCGNLIQCGTCNAPETCGGGEKTSVCGSGKTTCTPKTCADYPAKSCGPLADGCGGLIVCGTCTAPESCGGGGTASVCGGDSGCKPRTVADCAANGIQCGPLADGCGGFVTCGTCGATESCGAGGPAKCGASGGGTCTPKTCADLGFTCGPAGDGCGNLLNCGTCTAPQSCGGGGMPSKCGGTNACVPRTCAQLGATCGPAGDGCGGTLDCGTCASPRTCGGGGVPSVCGGASACVPLTPASCTSLGFNCGLVSDGCGGTVQCGAACPNNGVCGATSPNVCSNTTVGGGPDGGTTGGTVDITSGTVPPNPTQTFDPATHTIVKDDPSKVPTLVYPVNDTMFPQNIYRVLFQWNKRGLGLFQLSFTSPTLSLSVYTDGVQATCTAAANGGACWESAEDNWKKLAGSNAGQNVTVRIRGMASAAATTIYESPAYTIHFSRQSVPGALYYWSTTVEGVRRGALGDAAPTNFLTPAEAKNKCVACHTLSRNGKKMAADVDGEKLTVVDVSPTTPPPVNFGSIGTPAVTYANSWSTFNPSTTRIISADGGVAVLRNGTTGAAVSVTQPGGATNANGVIFPITEKAVQPDWAPDGAHVAFTRNSTKDRQGGTSIAWMTAGNDAFSNIQNIVSASAVATGVLVGYPMFNPTSNWLAFVAGPKIDKDPAAQLYVVAAQPNSAPQLLTRANTLVNDYPAPATPSLVTCPKAGDSTRCIENSIPTWAPSGEPQLQWVAFASLRDYGFVLRPGSKIGDGKQQLWIAAIDVSKLGSGDPSFPAFRVPFVELTENAHRPFWAEDAINPPTCKARTCADFPGQCGQQSDGCGGLTPDCLECTPPQTCGGGGTPSVCGGAACTPRTCTAAGAKCGSVADGCGGLMDCGICVAPQTCGGAGIPNQCGNPSCIPTTCAAQGFNCGAAGDGCGGLLDCGTCADPLICGGGGAPGVCGNSTCTPSTCAQQSAQCGPVGDGCGGLVDCGPCPSGQVCGGGGPSKCGASSCTPRTCQSVGATCGPIADGCGGSLDCGPCTEPGQTCGGGGTPNVCGGCTRTTCAAVGAECGPIGDGCGGSIDCGACTRAGDTCGGGGVAFKCGQPSVK